MKLMFISLALALSSVSLLVAEEHAASPEAEDNELEFVVTADRVVSEVRRSPSHVSVIRGEEIRRSGQTRIVDVLEQIPGIQSSSYTNPARSQMSMRGFGQQRVLVLVDGRRLNSPDMSGVEWMQIPVDRIERIEVVRGGGSSLYGNHAVAGVINIITRRPQDDVELSSGLTFGSFGLNSQRLGVGLARGGFSLAVSGERYSVDGYRDRSASNILQGTIEAGWESDGGYSARLSGEVNEHFYELPGGLTETQFEDDPTQAANEEDEATDQGVSINLENSAPIGDLAEANLDGGYRARVRESNFASYLTPTFTDETLQQFSLSPNYTHWLDIAGQALRLTGGFDGELVTVDQENYSDLERETKSSELTVRQLAGGAYLSGNLALGENVDISPQIRYDHASLAGNGFDEYDETTDYGAFSGALGVNYRPTSVAAVYARGARLFRYPATDEVAQNPTFIDPNEDVFAVGLNPETGWEATLGGRYEPGRILRAEASGYVLQMEDEIDFVVTDDATFKGTNRNIDTTRRFGGDLELQSRPVEPLELTAGYSYVYAVFADGEHEGNELSGVRPHSVDGSITVELPAGIRLEPVAQFRSGAYIDDDNDDRSDPYTTADLRLRWAPAFVPGELTVSAEVKNVFDEIYAPQQTEFAYYPAPGRNFQAGLSYSY